VTRGLKPALYVTDRLSITVFIVDDHRVVTRRLKLGPALSH
jgi:hypothetical protein